MLVELGFGEGVMPVDIPEKNLKSILRQNSVPTGLTGVPEVLRSLAHPIGTPPLRDIVKPGERVAVITSDITRPLPSYLVLPPVLDELWAAGVHRDDVTVVIALGSHRRQTDAEIRRLAGDAVYDTVRCVNGDADDCVRMGVTSRGTPVDVTRIVAEADRRIGLGNIEYHYFVGYSGGAKAIMPGVSSRDAIQANHSRMTLPEAAAGRLLDNPVRLDIEEAMRFCPLDFIVNVVLDEAKNIVFSVAGQYAEAHREGCAFLDSLYGIPVAERADIVIASQGGAPKDVNLYQTQKALDNAKHAVKKGGVVILVGSCREGMGEAVFEKWMQDARSPADLIERVETNFQLGGHKAAAIAMVLRDADVFLVSDMPSELVKSAFLTPYASARDALRDAFRKMGEDASVIVMPAAGSTLPLVHCQE